MPFEIYVPEILDDASLTEDSNSICTESINCTENKIKSLVLMRYQHQEMVLDGLMSIAEGQNPKAIQQRLQGYLR